MVRHKNRYFVVKVTTANIADVGKLTLKQASLYKEITQKVQQLHGDFGAAAIRAGFTTKYCNENTRIAVIRCRHGPHVLVESSLPFVTSIEEKNVALRTLYTGATIRQCFKFIKRYQQQKFDEVCSSLKTNDEKIELRQALMDVEAVLTIT